MRASVDMPRAYVSARRMEELSRESFTDQQIYDEGVSLVEIHCGE